MEEQAAFERVKQKVKNGERLTIEDGLVLYNSDNLLEIGQLANEVNLKKNGKNVYFIQNMYINPTNVCEAQCAFCNYKCKSDEEGAYTMTEEELLRYVEERWNDNVREFHITGGHNNEQPFEYYLNNIRLLKKHYPQCTIKAYGAAEIEFFSRLSGLSIKEVLEQLMEAGVSTLPGGGAEILIDEYRQKMKVNKATPAQYLEVHKVAHELGMKTHATMLYGAIESFEDRLIHMDKLRTLQDETNGFMVFIPLAVQPISANAGLTHRTTAYEDLKTIAISRLFLDNFDHIKAYWINIGPQLTQVALSFGADDIHGTLIEERISHAAGALTAKGITRNELAYLVKTADRVPVERDTFYRPIHS